MNCHCSYAMRKPAFAVCMGESSKFPKSWTLEVQNLKLALCLQNSKKKSSLTGQMHFKKLKINQRSYNNLPNSVFWGWLSIWKVSLKILNSGLILKTITHVYAKNKGADQFSAIFICCLHRKKIYLLTPIFFLV